MQLYLITPTGRTGYDDCVGLVVRAQSEDDARHYAVNEKGYEGFTEDNIRVEPVTADGERGEVLASFAAG